MEYIKDKRTKNLTLRDIHVGDWVQVWSEITERYSPPMKIMQICDDGMVYLIPDDENRCTPWEENIKDIDALPIDGDLLRGFGFEEDLLERFYVYKNSVFAENKQLTVMDISYLDRYGETIYLEDVEYMHELQQALHEERNFIETFEPEWKGVKKMSKELCCGECDKYLYEDACGYGRCKQNDGVCHCGDLCHLIHGKP